MAALWKLMSVAAACCAVLAAAAPAATTAADFYASLPPSCDSQIYCQGDLLRVVQNAHLYSDSKTFIDKKLLQSPDDTLADFDAFMQTYKNAPTNAQIQSFVDAHFADGDELVAVDLEDWVEQPALLGRIADPQLRDWASQLNVIWKSLSRKVNDTIKDNSDRYSIIYVPNHFVVPGGRFRELYYWDTYWVVRGLILSDMSSTIKGILENFFYLLDNYGIIPNGARVYYLQRTQPPLLTPMVYEYYQATKDAAFVRDHIALLERELEFWLKNRTLQVNKDGKTYTLAHYYAPSKGPRPESYWEDYTNGEIFADEDRKEEFYVDLKSAAESGWDFSSRWFITDGTDEGNLTAIHTKYIVPVDINAFVYYHADLLSQLHSELGDVDKAASYKQIATQLQEAITAVLWNDELGSWFDYDLLNNKQRTYFYASNMAPLWTKAYDLANTAQIARKATAYLKSQMLLDFPGGIPMSLKNSGQQWDLPNAWPPLQHIVIRGLQDTQEPSAQELAFELAQHWIASNFKAFQDTHEMFEKYDAELFGKYGGGGEYVVQSGFGWTNGVALDFLNMWSDRLVANTTFSSE
ncbi:hypothetical protein R5R35_000939 [Gryllus longicercus]|uniref:Trehalase n=1 Tax=Gryllus longicercus TaxID=2509291 RepID=A0AAN9VRB8_9ORTH